MCIFCLYTFVYRNKYTISFKMLSLVTSLFLLVLNERSRCVLDNMAEDMDVDLDKEFLQDLKDLKILITDKDLLDQHKRCVCQRKS